MNRRAFLAALSALFSPKPKPPKLLRPQFVFNRLPRYPQEFIPRRKVGDTMCVRRPARFIGVTEQQRQHDIDFAQGIAWGFFTIEKRPRA